jgi:phosphoglycerol transferase MdoB-like AlkP superfamily enzyme
VKKTIYFIFAVLGLVLPYYFLISFLSENGLNLALIIQELFANKISTFFAIDLIISIIVFWFYLYHEATTRKMKNWWVYILASLTVGLSFALPLFLYFRERHIENNK